VNVNYRKDVLFKLAAPYRKLIMIDALYLSAVCNESYNKI